MAVISFKVPVSVAKFPFDYHKASRAVLDPGQDVASRTPLSLYGDEANVDYNLIKLLYCENMMPTDYGMKAVGYVKSFSSLPGISSATRSVIDATDSSLLCFVSSSSDLYRYRGGSWNLVGGVAGQVVGLSSVFQTTNRHFVITNNPVAPFSVPTQSIWELTPTGESGVSFTFEPATGWNAVDDTLLNFVGVGNYTVGLQEFDYLGSNPSQLIIWSSLIDPLDFRIAGSSGAGYTSLAVPIGRPYKLVALGDGFLVLGTRGVASALPTNNGVTPFIYRVVPNAPGNLQIEEVAGGTTSTLYGYTKDKFFQITHQRADEVFPDLADYLLSDQRSSWTVGTYPNHAVSIGGTLYCKYLAGRYLCFSEGFVFDTQLQRWGKMDKQLQFMAPVYINHSGQVLSRTVPCSVDTTLTGAIFAAVFQGFDAFISSMPAGSVVPYGKMIFGHVKSRRHRKVTLQKVTVDGISIFSAAAYALPSIPGAERSTSTALSYSTSEGQNFMEWKCRVSGDNIDVGLAGDLDISTIVLEVTQHGSR